MNPWNFLERNIYRAPSREKAVRCVQEKGCVKFLNEMRFYDKITRKH